MEPLALYESHELREITGPTIRPGGFTLTRRAVEFCHLTEGATVVDIGCGLGATVNWLEAEYGLKALGLDASIRLLQDGRSISPLVSLLAGRADRLPFRGDSFAGVLCECVLSLLDDPLQALVEFGRVLRPGGWLMITDLYAPRAGGDSTLKHIPFRSCLKGVRPRREIVGLVEGGGFEPVLWEDHSILLKQLASNLVFEYGSMQEFWSLFAPHCSVSEGVSGHISIRPGYYLMVARKRG